MYTPSSFFSPLLLSHYLTPSFASLSLFFFLLFCLKLDKYLLSVLWVVSNEMWNKGFSTGIRAQGMKVYLKGRQRFPESYSPMTVTPKYTRRGSLHWLHPACLRGLCLLGLHIHCRQLPHKSIKTEKWGMILNEHGYKVQRGGGCVYDVGCVCVTCVRVATHVIYICVYLKIPFWRFK